MSNTPLSLNDVDLTRLVNVRDHVLVKFWAPWCQPCKAFAPVFEAAAERHPEVGFGQVDVDDQPATGVRLGVRALPTVQGWKNGNLVLSRSGLLSSGDLDKVIAELIRDDGAAQG